VAIEQFPELLIANLFRFGSFELLRFSDSEKKDVDVKKLFA
jgi:LemA protein